MYHEVASKYKPIRITWNSGNKDFAIEINKYRVKESTKIVSVGSMDEFLSWFNLTFPNNKFLNTWNTLEMKEVRLKPSRKIGQLKFVFNLKFKLFNYEKKKLYRKQDPFDYQPINRLGFVSDILVKYAKMHVGV